MIELRPYQKDAILNLREGFKKHHRQVLCSPTGSGKTVIFSEMVRMASNKPNARVLVLTDRIELFKQTFASLERTGVKPQILNAAVSMNSFNKNAVVTVAMVETIARRDLGSYKPTLIIIDEAHKGNFSKILEKYPEAKTVGATATPVGKHMAQYYDDIVETIDIPELVRKGFLAPCIAYQMQDKMEGLTVRAGEYTNKSLINIFDDKTKYIGVVDEYLKKANGRKTIVFNVNIKHSNQMCEEFNARGVESYSITSKTSSEERERILKAFKNGEFPVLNNCGILTTGYDEPSIECVIMNRKTKSLPLWLQCVGRGSRIFPGKENFIVLDFGRNHDEHGLWAAPREWKLKQKKSNKEKAAPLKECPNCYGVNYASAKECIVCGFVFPIKKTKEIEGIMVRIDSGVPKSLEGKFIAACTIDELILLQKVKKYKSHFIWRVVRSMGAMAIQEYAMKMMYSNGWIYNQKQKMYDSDFTNFIIK